MSEVDQRREQRMGTLELITAMMLSGTIGIFVIESGASPFTVVFFRCVFGAIALGSYCAIRGFFRNTGLTWSRVRLAALGGLFIVFNWAFLFESYDKTSITIATVVYHTQPFYVVLLGAIVFRDRLTKLKLAWIVLAFGGVVLVSGLASTSLAGDQQYLLGLGYALAAAVFYAFATIIAKKLKGTRPHLIALIQVLVGIPVLAPFARFSEVGSLGAGWAWLVGLGVIHTCVMYILMYSSYQKLPTPAIAVLSFIYPAVAIVADMLVYGTRISPLQALGILVIAVASLGMSLNIGARPPATATPVMTPTKPSDVDLAPVGSAVSTGHVKT